jgi:hypothetical protein
VRKLLLAGASALLFAASTTLTYSEPDGVAPKNWEPSAKGAEQVEPGKVGPGSEKNSQVSPTSPDIPTHAQPPPDINLPADSGSSGSGTGEQGRSNTNNSPPSGAGSR